MHRLARSVITQRELNFVGNLVRDLTLKCQQVAQFAVVGPRPEMTLVLHLYKLGGDSHFIRIATHASLEHIVCSQFTPDLVQRRLAVLVVHDRGTRDHSQVLRIEVAQLRDHFLGHAVAKIFLPRVSCQILEGKDRQHQPSSWLSRRIARTGQTDVTDRSYDQNNAEGGGEHQPGFLAPATRPRSPCWSAVTLLILIHRRLRPTLFFFLLQTQSAALHPGIELRTERVDRAYPVMLVAVNGHSLPLLPALDRGHVALEVGRDFLPRIQLVHGRLHGRRCAKG